MLFVCTLFAQTKYRHAKTNTTNHIFRLDFCNGLDGDGIGENKIFPVIAGWGNVRNSINYCGLILFQDSGSILFCLTDFKVAL